MAAGRPSIHWIAAGAEQNRCCPGLSGRGAYGPANMYVTVSKPRCGVVREAADVVVRVIRSKISSSSRNGSNESRTCVADHARHAHAPHRRWSAGRVPWRADPRRTFSVALALGVCHAKTPVVVSRVSRRWGRSGRLSKHAPPSRSLATASTVQGPGTLAAARAI